MSNNKENNPYIEKVESHSKIINITSEIYKNKGKWNVFFANDNDIVLEIGTGMGNYFSDEVANNKNLNFIGMEIKFKRLFVTAEKCLKKGASNNFVLIKDFGQNIDKIFNLGEVSKVVVFFPDPWGKKDRQKKHRLFSQEFVDKLYFVLKKGGKLLFKTDHKEYFETTLTYFSEDKWEKNKLSFDYERELDDFDKSKMTEFEHIFRKDKLKINYVEFLKK